ncbi:MAG: DUF3857 and transglutaminase domain-containing protein, partial [Candidatus Omnitrophica bacterium]|nr:DUF3857 and transglutaminase domain-containing protein [Candidatus Omnitrophota bacterium]
LKFSFFLSLAIISGCIFGPEYKPEKIQNFEIIPDRSAVYLLDIADVFVYPSGASITTVHQKILVTGEKGKHHGTLQISYDEERQSVEIIEAKTITPDNKVINVRKSDIRIITPAELSPYSVLYPGIRVCTITFPAVNIGSTIEYIYRIRTKKPLMQGEFWDGFYFQSTEPFILSRYTLTLPESKRLYTHPFCVDLKEKKKKRKLCTYRWEKSNMPALIPENMMPPLSEIVPRILVTTIKDWEAIGRWFFNLARDSTNPDSSIIATAKKITEKATTEEEKIKAVYHFICQNIRYLGLELGIHGFKPHDAKDVLRLGYGDCKDKSALMVAMLKTLGIKSYIALINTERDIEENVPFPGQFNHAIVAVLKDNGFLILDPTSEVIPFPELPPSDQNKTVLIPTEDRTFLIKTEGAKAEENQKKREIVAFLDSTGDIKASVTIEMNGIFAASIRNTFRYLSDEERKRELLKSLNRIIPNTSLESFNVEGISSLDEPVKQSYAFYSKKYATDIQARLLFKPALLEKIETTELISLAKRNYSIRYPYRSLNVDRITFNLPDNCVVDAFPDPVEIETKFGIYLTRFEIEKNKLIYERVFSLNMLEIKPEEYLEFKKFFEQVAYNDSLQVILKKTH